MMEDGNTYELDQAKGIQRIVLYHVLKTIKMWLENDSKYLPMHRILSGGGGVGKSFLIHQITTAIRRIFSLTTTVEPTAFTGCAANNIGGRTLNSAYAVNCISPDSAISQDSRDKLLKELKYTVAILIDERSMISAELLGAVERNIAQTVHGGLHYDMPWGGVPVVILLGDDYQLPPVCMNGRGQGAFYCTPNEKMKEVKLNMKLRGMQLFQQFSYNSIDLTQSHRILQDQSRFRALAENCRVGSISENDKKTIMALRIHLQPSEIRNQIENSNGTLHLFATKEKCLEHNFKKLHSIHSVSNPVAFISHKIPKHMTDSTNDLNKIPRMTYLCQGCRVSIKGRNFNPKWGLYNGAIGTVQEIVFR